MTFNVGRLAIFPGDTENQGERFVSFVRFYYLCRIGELPPLFLSLQNSRVGGEGILLVEK